MDARSPEGAGFGAVLGPTVGLRAGIAGAAALVVLALDLSTVVDIMLACDSELLETNRAGCGQWAA